MKLYHSFNFLMHCTFVHSTQIDMKAWSHRCAARTFNGRVPGERAQFCTTFSTM